MIIESNAPTLVKLIEAVLCSSRCIPDPILHVSFPGGTTPVLPGGDHRPVLQPQCSPCVEDQPSI